MAKFIVFEGPDGSGKTSVMQEVIKRLSSPNIIATREPGGTENSELIRNILLGSAEPVSKRTEALLMAASRAELVDKLILPSLNEGKHVFCDRYIISSLVYQGCARGLGVEIVEKINDFASSKLIPDLCIFFDIDYEIALTRRHVRDTEDNLEREDDSFHRMVHKSYGDIYLSHKEKFNMKRIDANLDFDKVVEDVIELIKTEVGCL